MNELPAASRGEHGGWCSGLAAAARVCSPVAADRWLHARGPQLPGRAMIERMADLSRGANAPLATGPVEVAVSGARQGSVDLMVFQLGADRKVRSDADFVFFNQPASPEGAVRLVAAHRITADLSAVPAAVETLAVAVALDDAVPGSLAGIAGLGVTVSGGEVHRAPATGLTTERAAVLVELYRRAGGWKVRNVSAGWAAGLSALVTEHGVSVDDEPRPRDETPPPPPARPAQPPPQARTAHPPQQAVPAYPPPPQRQAAASPRATTPPPSPQPVPAAPPGWQPPGGYPPPGGSLPPRPAFVPPQPGGWTPPGGSLAGAR